MAVYLINSYDIEDMTTFSSYPPLVAQLLKKYHAEVLASDLHGFAIEGKAKTMNAIIRFPSEEAVTACYNDPEYTKIKAIRLRSTSNCTMVVVNEFVK